MKCKNLIVCGLLLPAALTLSVQAEPLLPGQVDFGTFSPPGGGTQFVEVNLPASLIALAARFVEKHEPDVAKLINGVKAIRVNVIGINEDNQTDLEKRVQKVRKDLSGNGWERIVSAQQDRQDVGIYLKMDSASAIQGITVTVIEPKKQAVFVNVVGDIKPEQLTMLGDKFDIEPLKKLGPMKHALHAEKQVKEEKQEKEEK